MLFISAFAIFSGFSILDMCKILMKVCIIIDLSGLNTILYV